MTRRARQRLARPLALGDPPPTLVQEPGDEGADGIGERGVHGRSREPAAPPVGLRDRQGDDAWLARELVNTMMFAEQ